MGNAVRAGIAYFAVVFAAGFALGALRVTALVPRIGETAAVALELPLMLTVSWLACRWLIGAFAVPRTRGARIVMGAVGFMLLIAAEFGLGAVLVGRSIPMQLAAWRELPGALGLAAQVAFGLLPLVALRVSRQWWRR